MRVVPFLAAGGSRVVLGVGKDGPEPLREPSRYGILLVRLRCLQVYRVIYSSVRQARLSRNELICQVRKSERLGSIERVSGSEIVGTHALSLSVEASQGHGHD